MSESETIPAPAWVILTKHMLAIRFSFDYGHLSTMSFRVFLASEDEDGKWDIFATMDNFPLSEWGSVPWEIDGALKWDGCINWQTNPDCMAHGCGPRYVDQITAIFQTVYSVGKRRMSLLGDEVKPLPDGALEVGEEGEKSTVATA
jgi:hypothetical protein